MVDTYIISFFVGAFVMLLICIIINRIDINKHHKEFERHTEQKSLVEREHTRYIKDLNERVGGLEGFQNEFRKYAQQTIIAECAKYGLHPSDYIDKHSKTDNNRVVPVLVVTENNKTDSEYIYGKQEENEANYESIVGKKEDSNGSR